MMYVADLCNSDDGKLFHFPSSWKGGGDDDTDDTIKRWWWWHHTRRMTL